MRCILGELLYHDAFQSDFHAAVRCIYEYGTKTFILVVTELYI